MVGWKLCTEGHGRDSSKGRSGGEHLPVHRITLITLKYANPPYHINLNICNSKNGLRRVFVVDCDCAPV